MTTQFLNVLIYPARDCFTPAMTKYSYLFSVCLNIKMLVGTITKMKKILTFSLVLFTFISSMSYASPAEPAPERAEIMELVKILAHLTDKADACGEHMNYFGKKALEGAVCKEFHQGFFELWPSREALQDLVADYVMRLQGGEYQCDNCDVMLQRIEELRITITYYLDYMDFMKEF